MTLEERIKVVREMFDLEEGEEFNIVGCEGNPYRFVKAGLYDYKGNKSCGISIGFLIVGQYKVEKLPWKPKDRDLYWILDITEEDGIYDLQYFNGSKRHERIIKHKETFKTEEDAIEERNKQEWWCKE